MIMHLFGSWNPYYKFEECLILRNLFLPMTRKTAIQICKSFFGQNGSGKTVLIDALEILKYVA